MVRILPDLRLEVAHAHDGPVAGVDEVGRGPLAGPVVAAAVILGPGDLPAHLDDSKRLSPARRIVLDRMLRDTAAIGVGVADVDEIERLNILQAGYLAMCRAIAALPTRPGMVLVDGTFLPPAMNLPGRAIVGGDRISASIAAASVVAKVFRDRLMEDLAQHHRGYGWETNMGYGTRAHLAALQHIGPSPHHRRTFAPVHRILYQHVNSSR